MPFINNRNTNVADNGGGRSSGGGKKQNTSGYYSPDVHAVGTSSLPSSRTSTASTAKTSSTAGNKTALFPKKNNLPFNASSGNLGSGFGYNGMTYVGPKSNATTPSSYSALGNLGSSLGYNGTTYVGPTNLNPTLVSNSSGIKGTSDTKQAGNPISGNAGSRSDNPTPSGKSIVDLTIDAVNDAKDKYLTPSNNPGGGTPSGGSGGGSRGGSGGGSGSGGGGATVEDTTTTTEQTDAKTEQDNTIDKIKELLTEQQKQAEDRYKTLYEQELAKNKQAWEANRNQINLNYKRGQRFADATYGNELSGAGLTNRMRLNSNWINNLNTNRLNYINNDATALANYDANKSGAYGTLAQGWYNYVLPTYANRVQNDDDYSYRRFLAQSGLM